MKKTTVSIISMIISVIMILILFTGCNNQSAYSISNSNNQSNKSDSIESGLIESDSIDGLESIDFISKYTTKNYQFLLDKENVKEFLLDFANLIPTTEEKAENELERYFKDALGRSSGNDLKYPYKFGTDPHLFQLDNEASTAGGELYPVISRKHDAYMVNYGSLYVYFSDSTSIDVNVCSRFLYNFIHGALETFGDDCSVFYGIDAKYEKTVRKLHEDLGDSNWQSMTSLFEDTFGGYLVLKWDDRIKIKFDFSRNYYHEQININFENLNSKNIDYVNNY